MAKRQNGRKSRGDRLPTFLVTKREDCKKRTPTKDAKPAARQLVDDIITEVAGFAPYEKRVMELLKVGTASTMKRALKVLKKRLGNHSAAKKKHVALQEAIAAQKRHHA